MDDLGGPPLFLETPISFHPSSKALYFSVLLQVSLGTLVFSSSLICHLSCHMAHQVYCRPMQGLPNANRPQCPFATSVGLILYLQISKPLRRHLSSTYPFVAVRSSFSSAIFPKLRAPVKSIFSIQAPLLVLPGGFRIGTWNSSFGTVQRAGARGDAQAWETCPKRTRWWLQWLKPNLGEQWKKPGCLVYIGGYTIQLYRVL